MGVQDQAKVFDWDVGNLDKSRRKHGVTPEESESVFTDEQSLVIPDTPHSKKEDRFVIVGKSDKKRYLFIVFAKRKEKIRIISARRMHKEEVKKYGKM